MSGRYETPTVMSWSVCGDCGCIVADTERHDAWHEERDDAWHEERAV